MKVAICVLDLAVALSTSSVVSAQDADDKEVDRPVRAGQQERRGESVGRASRERVRGIAPEVFLVILTVDVFLEPERFHRDRD